MFLVKTEIVCHFVNMLAKVETNTQQYIEQAGLPENILTSKYKYMPEIPVRNLLEIIQQKSGDALYQKMLWQSCQSIFIPQVLYRIKKAQNIQQAIEEFVESFKEDAPHSEILMAEVIGKTWLGRHKTPDKAPWFELSEQFVLVYMIELIRALSNNKHWLPAQLSIQSDQVNRYQLLLAHQKNSELIQIISERKYSAICIPPALLKQAYYPKLYWSDQDTDIIAEPNFLGSLKMMLPAYLCAGKLSINKVAQITGLSVRTLQRYLKNNGISYRELLEEVQMVQAKSLLKENIHNITAISNHLGYSNISHFSRAFKKATGFAPSQFKARDER